MFKNISLNMKLYYGFGAVLALLAVLATAALLSLNGIGAESDNYVRESDHERLILEKELALYRWIAELQRLFSQNLETTEVDVQTDHTKSGIGQFIYGEEGKVLTEADQKAGEFLEKMKDPNERLHSSAKLIKAAWKKRHRGLTQLLHDRLHDILAWTLKVSESIIERNSSPDVQLDPTKCAFGLFLASDQLREYIKDFPQLGQIMDSVRLPHERLHESASRIATALRAGRYEEANQIYVTVTLPALQDVEKYFKQAIEAEIALEAAQQESQDIFATQTLTALADTQSAMLDIRNHFSKKSSDAEERLMTGVSSSQWTTTLLSLVIFVLGVAISIFLARSISKPIRNVIEGLTTGAEQVAAASSQVAQSSQQNAEGASEQASSLEEISSSLEELSSMTKQNADNAKQADALSQATAEATQKSGATIDRLTEEIGKIKSSSDETAKIVKTIDEIAFQTNLLALNAAVEAARAGEAGKGFAVVAEEVRNLAQRSAEAAKDTAELIEESQRNAQSGVTVSEEAADALKEVTSNVQKVTHLISEVSAASVEQTEGIEQINIAVSQLDQVTQANAANAEEGAASSEELSGQARDLTSIIGQLVRVVNGGNATQERRNGGNGGHIHTATSLQAANVRPQKSLVAAGNKSGDGAGADSDSKEKVVIPEQVIPLDDSELNDF